MYGSLCAELKQPFIFPGTERKWHQLSDLTDADLVAEQMIWAATHAAGRNQAFNAANGDVFRWRWMWPRLAEYFGVEWEGFCREPRPLRLRIEDMARHWKHIALSHDLVEHEISKLASWWHTDLDLGVDLEVLTDMNKSRQAGFLGFRDTAANFEHRFDQYRQARLIP